MHDIKGLEDLEAFPRLTLQEEKLLPRIREILQIYSSDKQMLIKQIQYFFRGYKADKNISRAIKSYLTYFNLSDKMSMDVLIYRIIFIAKDGKFRGLYRDSFYNKPSSKDIFAKTVGKTL